MFCSIRTYSMEDILFVELNHKKFCIRSADLLSTKIIDKINIMPFLDPAFAPMCLLEDKLAYFGDLSYCITGQQINRKGQFTILVLSDSEKLAGFVINGKYEEPKQDLHDFINFPEYFKQSIIKSCLFFDNNLIPVIDIKELYRDLLNENEKYKEFYMQYGGVEKDNVKNSLIILNPEDESFALPSDKIIEVIDCPEILCTVPFVPDHIKGITVHNHKIVPVIDLEEYIDLKNDKQEYRMLIYQLKDQEFGFLINKNIIKKTDQKKGSVFIQETKYNEKEIKSLPFLVRSDWLNNAYIKEGKIIPIININNIILGKHDEETAIEIKEHYKPDSKVASEIFKKPLPVVEFSVYGLYCAVPECEAEEIEPVTGIRVLPSRSPMVIGTVLFNDEILPVIDLSVCYGRRLNYDNEYKMILLKNGNLKVVIITDNVSGKVILPVKNQRELPAYSLTTVLYGCYLKENTVCLIFNILELIIQFKKEKAHEFIKKFSSQLNQQNHEVNKADLQNGSLETGSDEMNLLTSSPEEKIERGTEEENNTEPADTVESESTEHIETETDFKTESTEYEEKDSVPDIDEKIFSESNDNLKKEEVNYPDTANIKTTEEESEYGENESVQEKRKKLNIKNEEQKKSSGIKKLNKYAVIIIISVFLVFLFIDVFKLFESENEDPGMESTAITEITEEEKLVNVQEDIPAENNEIATELLEEIKDKFIKDVRVDSDAGNITVTLENIRFLPDSYELLPEEIEKLNSITGILKKYSDKNLIIVGHTAFTGIYLTLQELSEKRAQAVRNYLLSLNIWREDQIDYKGMGPDEPVADNSTEEGRQKNRRVEIKIINY